MKACFMEIAKLYDSSNGVVSIGTLLAKCAENQDLFPEYRETMTVEHDGTAFSYQIPYQHQLKPQEERFSRLRLNLTGHSLRYLTFRMQRMLRFGWI